MLRALMAYILDEVLHEAAVVEPSLLQPLLVDKCHVQSGLHSAADPSQLPVGIVQQSLPPHFQSESIAPATTEYNTPCPSRDAIMTRKCFVCQTFEKRVREKNRNKPAASLGGKGCFETASGCQCLVELY
eukprot:scaffold223390_cov35-Prasinocladus_malaysianus.AAC.1